jgi:hypothetical protein
VGLSLDGPELASLSSAAHADGLGWPVLFCNDDSFGEDPSKSMCNWRKAGTLELVSKHERQPGQNREPLVDVAHMYPVSWKYICTTHCLTQAPCGSAQTFPAHQSVRLLRVILACPCRFFSAARPGLSAVTTSPSVATCTMSFLRVGCFRWLVPHLEATPRSPLR